MQSYGITSYACVCFQLIQHSYVYVLCCVRERCTMLEINDAGWIVVRVATAHAQDAAYLVHQMAVGKTAGSRTTQPPSLQGQHHTTPHQTSA